MPGATKLEHGGEVYRLKLTNRALFRLDEESEQSIAELGERVNAGSFRAIVLLFWACLLDTRPKITPLQAADLIDRSDLAGLGEALGRELTRAFPGSRKAEDAGSAEGAGDADTEGVDANPPVAAD